MDLSKLLTRTQIAKALGLSTVQAAKLLAKAGIQPQVTMRRGTKQTAEYYSPKDAERLIKEQEARHAQRQARAAAFAAKATEVLTSPGLDTEQFDALLAVANAQAAALQNLAAQIRQLEEKVDTGFTTLLEAVMQPASTALDKLLDMPKEH